MPVGVERGTRRPFGTIARAKSERLDRMARPISPYRSVWEAGWSEQCMSVMRKSRRNESSPDFLMLLHSTHALTVGQLMPFGSGFGKRLSGMMWSIVMPGRWQQYGHNANRPFRPMLMTFPIKEIRTT